MFKRPYESRKRYLKEIVGETMTEQHHKDACDVNNILKKYYRTGVIEHRNRFSGDYGDFCDVPEYKHGLDRINAANAMFDALPSKIRSRFKNDALEFLAFVKDDANRDEAVALGLIDKKPEVDGVETPLGV